MIAPGPPSSDATVIEGRIERVLWVSPDEGFAVLKVQGPGGGTIVVGPLGALADHDPEHPVFATFEGSWERHATHGHRFRADAFLIGSPRTQDGLKQYLASAKVPGVGPAIAARIVDRFGDDVLRVLEAEPARLADVPGVGDKRALAIAEAWAADGEGRAVTILLQGLGVSPGRITRIRQRYGDGAFKVVQQRPYELAETVPGIGFVLADRIARAQGIPADDPARLDAAIRHVVKRVEDDGDCWIPRGDLARKVGALDVPTDGLVEAVDVLVAQAKLEPVEGEDGVAHPHLAGAEHQVAAHLAFALDNPVGAVDVEEGLARAGRALGITLDPSQEAALRVLVGHPVAVLTGGPGTGKTTLVRALLRVWREAGIEASLAAPTGRAARRLAEATGQDATTLHRLLEANPGEGGFQRHAERPLEVQALVVDEASMIDIKLMAALLDALPSDAVVPLVLVGDADQLPSVGPGQVLRDLVSCGVVPVARLTTVHRQAAASGIVVAARSIHDGEVPVSGEAAGFDDLYLLDRSDPEAARRTLVEIVAKRLPAKGFDPFHDVVVLAPTRRGPLGTHELNALLRHALHPQAADQKLRLVEGDKVICVKNRHDLEVYNGDLGRVEAVGRDASTIRFDDRVVDWPREDLDQIEHAYAVTVHKSQGSEYPAVVLALHRSHGIMRRRTLLYTAVTRAKGFFCGVGDRASLAKAVATPDDGRRTQLVRLLQDRLGEG